MRKMFFALLLVGLLSGVAFSEIPETISIQGRLVDSTGEAITETTSVTFKLYDAASDGSVVHTEELSVTPDSNGIFSVILGESTPFTTADFLAPYWLEISIDGTPIGDRQQVTSVPYAMTAKDLKGGSVWAVNTGDGYAGYFEGETKVNGRFVGNNIISYDNVETMAPDVSQGNIFFIYNDSKKTIDHINNGVPGQIVTFVFMDKNTTIPKDNAFFFLNGTDFISAIHSTIQLICVDGTTWAEIARSNNGP